MKQPYNENDMESVNQYLRDNGLDPEQVAKEGSVFVKTLIDNMRIKKRLRKPKLESSAVREKRMSVAEVYRYYFPGASDEEVDFFFWEKTAFPFGDVEGILDALYKKYMGLMQSLFPIK